MILFEEEKSKLLLGGMPYLRPLYIKGVLSMYEILSISWKESLIDLKKKYENLKSNKEKDDKSNNRDNETKELNNKMFLIFSFMNHFYQMINKGKLNKYDGLDYIYSKLNNFFTLCRKIISYKILDINLEEFNQTKIILRLIIHVKLFLIFCEYDTYESKKDFIDDILLALNPKENLYKDVNINNEIKDNIINDKNKKEEEPENNYTNKEKEELVIQNLIKEIKIQNINLDNIYSYMEKIYNPLSEKYKNFINENKSSFMNILYENYFEINLKEEDKENSDEEDDTKINNNEQSNSKKKKKKRRNKKKKNKNKEQKENNNNDIILNNNEDKKEDINEIKEDDTNKNEIKNEKTQEEESEESKINKMAKINEKITMIKTIQSIAKMANKLINNIPFTESFNSEILSNSENKVSLQQNKSDFEEIKKHFLEPLIPYIKQYQKVYGNKKMSILSLLQCTFIVYEEKYRKEKEKLLKEIDNLKKAMNHMFIQIQLMGGGRDIFKSTLFYLILIFIPEEQNIPSFFTRVQKLLSFFEQKVNDDLNLIKNITSNNCTKTNENMNVIINRLHKNSQYVLFVKSLFFMYKFFNFVVHLNKNEKLQNKNDETKKQNEINENNNFNDSSISKINAKNIKYNLINENFPGEENSNSIDKTKKNMIYPTLNFNDCFSSYANFLDEIVTNEKTQIILEQVIEKIETENNAIDGPRFEIKDLFMEKEGKKVFNLTGFDVQIIIHDIKKMKYKDETLENLVNSKTWEKSQEES